MIDTYLADAGSVRRAVAGMSRAQLLARPVPGRWSTLEVVCHLSDTESIYADRMKRILVEDTPLLIRADEKAYAAHLANHERDLEEELALIELTRKQMARLLRPLSDEVLRRPFRFRLEGREETRVLEQILASAISHTPHHLPFIQEKRRALGLPDYAV
jgi:hypothetical protein